MTTHDGNWPDGTPCWTDLSVADLKGSWELYSALLGWEIVDQGEEFGHYGIGMLGGRAAAAIGPHMVPGQPTAWTTYLATADVDKTADAVVAAGGTLLVPPGDVGPAGRMGIAVDPTGAVVGLWQAGEMPGFGVVADAGAIGWTDLHTGDPARAMDFYTAVFGWTYSKMDGPFDYWTIDGPNGPGDPIGAIGEVDPSLPAGSATWLPYFMVADADAAITTLTGHGGEVLSGPVDTPFGRLVRAKDAEGALFTIMGIPAQP